VILFASAQVVSCEDPPSAAQGREERAPDEQAAPSASSASEPVEMASLMSFDVSHEEPDWASPEQRDVVYNVIQDVRACDPGDPIVFVHTLAVRVIEEEGVPTRKGWILEMKCYATPGA
jgi:hypothetical protein